METSPPICRSFRTHNQARLVESFEDLFGKGALLAVLEVLLELRRATRAQDDAILWRQCRVVLAPAQRYLRKTKLVLLLEATEW